LGPGFALVRPADRNDPLSSITFRTSTNQLEFGWSSPEHLTEITTNRWRNLQVEIDINIQDKRKWNDMVTTGRDQLMRVGTSDSNCKETHSTSQQFTHKQHSTESPFSIGKLQPSSGPHAAFILQPYWNWFGLFQVQWKVKSEGTRHSGRTPTKESNKGVREETDLN